MGAGNSGLGSSGEDGIMCRGRLVFWTLVSSSRESDFESSLPDLLESIVCSGITG